MPDMKATEPQEVEKEEDQEENEDKPQPAPIKDKKHDSGAADLEKGDSIKSSYKNKIIDHEKDLPLSFSLPD